MIVEVDIGNTRLKWRVRGSSVVNAVPLSHWPEVLDCWRTPRAHKIIVSCVAAVTLKADFAAACAAQLKLQPEFVSVQDGLGGVKLAYSNPATLGVDRWLSMLWARDGQAEKNLVVVSAGSALTVDFLRSNGNHLGGLIMPGVAMSLAALAGGAAQLGSQTTGLSAMDFNQGFTMGGSTQECISAGLSLLYRGAMAELLAQCPFAVNSCSLVLAGGDSKILLSLCPEVVNVCVQPNLVLDGLSLIS